MKLNQVQIESRLADTVPFGLREKVVADTGIYPKIVDAYFNPNDERKSPQYLTLAIQSALDKLDPEAGEKHWQALSKLRAEGKSGADTSEAGKLKATVQRIRTELDGIEGVASELRKWTDEGTGERPVTNVREIRMVASRRGK